MKIQKKQDGEKTLIKFTGLNSGQLDLSHVKILRDKFKNIVLKGENHIIMDFSEVDYIDSSIIGFIVDTYNDIINNKGSLKLININKNIYEILEMINLVRFLDIERK